MSETNAHSRPETWITLCEGCKTPDWADDQNADKPGTQLAQRVEDHAQDTGLRTRRVSCTMGCERGCNVIVQGTGKIGYSLGKFEGTDADAQAIVDYALMHSASDTGQVPFRQWPQGVKGHFISRHLPLPEQDT